MDIISRFYQQGIKEGYIDDAISFELLVLYAKIFQAGFEAKMEQLQPDLADPQPTSQLLKHFFYGLTRIQGGERIMG